MADSSILTPGCTNEATSTASETPTEEYLVRDNYLTEYSTEEDKSVVRENLGVPSKDSVYTKTETSTLVSEKIQNVMQDHLNTEDPHGILPQVEEKIEGMVKTDGSTPFTAPQQGVDPTADNHLTTKKWVSKLLKEHTSATDPHGILPEVAVLLQSYAKSSDIYNKSQLYIKDDIDKLLKQFVKLDGTTSFTKAQVGADPIIDSHLATKRYVDQVMYDHKVDVDPHGFITILNNRLASYAKVKNVLDKSETYSRTQIDGLINSMVQQQLDLAIAEYEESVDSKFQDIADKHYVSRDGTVAFTAPQTGVAAEEDNQLVILKQLNEAIEAAKTLLTEKIDSKECVWKTSGPVESTVGHVEDNTQLQDELTLQEVCDAIFYGQGICLEVPDYVVITEKVPLTVCVHGSTGTIEYAEIYQNDKLIYTLQKEDFADGCTTVDSEALLEDAEFTFKVYYTSGAVHETSKTVKCYMPVFVGLLPKFKPAYTVTMDYLIQLAKEDTEGTQNRFLNQGKDLKSFTFKYVFEDADLRQVFIVLPKSYPDLETMVTKSQSFDVHAFEQITDIPLTVPGVEDDIIFKIYVYKQALSSLNQDVTFNFVSE